MQNLSIEYFRLKTVCVSFRMEFLHNNSKSNQSMNDVEC